MHYFRIQQADKSSLHDDHQRHEGGSYLGLSKHSIRGWLVVEARWGQSVSKHPRYLRETPIAIEIWFHFVNWSRHWHHRAIGNEVELIEVLSDASFDGWLNNERFLQLKESLSRCVRASEDKIKVMCFLSKDNKAKLTDFIAKSEKIDKHITSTPKSRCSSGSRSWLIRPNCDAPFIDSFKTSNNSELNWDFNASEGNWIKRCLVKNVFGFRVWADAVKTFYF